MTLNHLNTKFLQSNPVPATPFGTALIKQIREAILLHRPDPIHVGEELFDWLLTITETTPTATTQGKKFLRVYSGESFVDINQVLNSEANNK
jgi:hypothetical protein